MKKNFTLLLCLTFLALSGTLYAQVVTNGGDSGDGSLRQEIIDTPAGGTITFDPAVTTVTISSGDLDIDKDLTIEGPASGNIVIDANDTSRIFNITGGTVVLTNLDITDGTAVQGGGIYITNADVIINTSRINNNAADGDSTSSGGGIYLDSGSTLVINDSEINGNSANRAGGGIEDNTGAGLSLVINGVRMVNNNAGSTPGNGGAIHITGAGDSTITEAELFNNTAVEGGGFWNGTGTMTVDNSVLLNNTATGDDSDQGGGALYNNGGIMVVQNNTEISSNQATGAAGSGGGILNNLGTLTVVNSAIESNTAVRAGGGIEENSTAGQKLTLTNVDISDNSAGGNPGNGGGLHITGPGDSDIRNSQFTVNFADSEGGGIWNGTGLMIISRSIIDSNEAAGNDADNGGGGIYNNGGRIEINRDSAIRNNLATGTSGSGGGLFSTSNFILISRTTFENNSANRAGGGIEIIDGELIATNLILRNNDVNGTAGTPSPGNGGGVHITGSADISIIASDVVGNEAANEGGGLWNQAGSNMLVQRTDVDSNIAYGSTPDSGGGGIFNNGGNLEIRRSTLSNNQTLGVLGNGGGLFNDTDGYVKIWISTISGNSTLAEGGGIYNSGQISDLETSTVVQNTATLSGGGIQADSEMNVLSSIVALNSAPVGENLAGVITSGGYNLIGTDSGNNFPAESTDIEGSDPMIGPLQNNGGSTLTHALMDDSPAYNAGDPSLTYDDQRRLAVFDGVRDIGSFESQVNLSIKDFADASITSIHPNPARGKFFVDVANTATSELQLEIVSITGQSMGKYPIAVGRNEINVDNFASGIYVLKVSGGNSAISHKLILQ